jgi:hypothetical protein
MGQRVNSQSRFSMPRAKALPIRRPTVRGNELADVARTNNCSPTVVIVKPPQNARPRRIRISIAVIRTYPPLLACFLGAYLRCLAARFLLAPASSSAEYPRCPRGTDVASGETREPRPASQSYELRRLAHGVFGGRARFRSGPGPADPRRAAQSFNAPRVAVIERERHPQERADAVVSQRLDGEPHRVTRGECSTSAVPASAVQVEARGACLAALRLAEKCYDDVHSRARYPRRARGERIGATSPC